MCIIKFNHLLDDETEASMNRWHIYLKLLTGNAEDVAIQRLAEFIDRRLAPTARMISECTALQHAHILR